jgi:hypothetical protein
VTIVVHDFSGRFVTSTITNASGVYTAKGLQAGSYVVRTFNNLGYTDEAYVNISCAGGCQVTLGTLVPVTLGATTPNINFSLIVGGGISGTVTGTGGTPLSGVTVNV